MILQYNIVEAWHFKLEGGTCPILKTFAPEGNVGEGCVFGG
jgi:hypothetical protein